MVPEVYSGVTSNTWSSQLGVLHQVGVLWSTNSDQLFLLSGDMFLHMLFVVRIGSTAVEVLIRTVEGKHIPSKVVVDGMTADCNAGGTGVIAGHLFYD
jgi:hypothetical protein